MPSGTSHPALPCSSRRYAAALATDPGSIAIVLVDALAFVFNVDRAWNQSRLRNLGLMTLGLLALAALGIPAVSKSELR